MDDRRVLVKVSGAERCSKLAAPYRDAIALAAKLVDNPRRFYRYLPTRA